MYQLYRDRPLLVLSMALANILLSIWCLSLDPVINFDGVIYTSSAELILQGKVAETFNYFSWPFYSMFIAATAKLFMVDVETGAFVFNTLMAISLTLAFVAIISELSNNNRRIILIAVAVILLFPSISKYRAFVIRDFGYLSCYLWSLYFIFRFCATHGKHHLIGWLVFAGLSSLFRFEGIIFVLIAPYFLFLFSDTTIQHRKTLLAVLSVLIASTALALLAWYVNDKYTDSVETARLTGANINSLSDFFAANIQQRLGDRPLTLLSFAALLIENIGDVGHELIRRMAVLYFLLALYAWYASLTLKDALLRRIWTIYLVTNLLMLVGFSLSNNFIVSRYTMASALTLLILAPFAIDHVITRLQSATALKKGVIYFSLAVLALISLEGLDVRTGKAYIREAGEWLDQHAPEDADVYSNDRLAIYYMRRGAESNLDHLYSLDILKIYMQTGQIKTLDYVVLVGRTEDFNENLMRQTLAYRFGRPIKTFYGEEDRFAFVFDINARRLGHD